MSNAVRGFVALMLLAAAQLVAAAGCSVTSASMAFGTTSAGVAGPVDTQGTLSFTCTGVLGETVVYTVSLSAGGGGTGFNPRALRSGANSIQYNVYGDSARTRLWGDGTSGTFTESGSLSITGGPTPRSVPVYGRVFGGQSAKPGAYSDSLMITISF